MEQQTQPVSKKSNEKSTNIWLIIFAIILASLVAGGGVYLWQKSVAEQEKQREIESDMSKLQQQVTNLAEEQKPAENKPQGPSKQPTSPTTPTTEVKPSTEEGGEEDEYEGWLTYTSNKYSYEIKYPPDGEVSEAEKVAFSLSPEEVAEGKTFDDVYNEYTGQICVSVSYKLGYVNISAPINKEKGHVICGRTGVAYETESIAEQVTIEGNVYTAKGITEKGPGEQLMYHNETLGFELADETGIEYGAKPDEVKTYADYLEIKPTIRKIVESFKKL